MCCCTVMDCCCGCTSIKMGIIVWAIVDVVVNLIFGSVNLGMGNLGGIWILIMMVMAILLAVGTHWENTCLVIFWQVFMMIHIVGLFLMWLAIPIMLFGVSVANAVSEACENGDYNYSCTDSAIAWLDTYVALIIMAMIVIIVLPITYIYWWIVVNSYRKQVVAARTQTIPVAMGGSGEPVKNDPPAGAIEKF